LIGSLTATGGTPTFTVGSITTGAMTVSGSGAGVELQFTKISGTKITPNGVITFSSGVNLVAPEFLAGSTVVLNGCRVQSSTVFAQSGLTMSMYLTSIEKATDVLLPKLHF
jgi:hypothetical protein